MYTFILQLKAQRKKGIPVQERRLTIILFFLLGWMFFSFAEKESVESHYPPVVRNATQSLCIEHEMFKLGGVLSALNAAGKVAVEQNVITSPAEVDVTTWNPGKYILVFKANNYNSIVATVDIP